MPVHVYNYNLFQEVQEQEDDPLLKLKSQKLVSCRICKGDHWTTKCPYKDTLGPLQVKLVKSRTFLTFGFFSCFDYYEDKQSQTAEKIYELSDYKQVKFSARLFFCSL